jgi:hypothetical protein
MITAAINGPMPNTSDTVVPDAITAVAVRSRTWSRARSRVRISSIS